MGLASFMRTGKPVRLDLTEKDHKRLDEHARKKGLSKASLSRMIILEWLDERDKEKKGAKS